LSKNIASADNVTDDLGFITITTDEGSSTVQCFIRGIFLPPELIAKELTTLHAMASQFSTIEFTINSPGGSVDTLIEMLHIKDKYANSVGVATGQAASAGSLLWAACDFRVIYPYTSFMFHRESYGMYGQSAVHKDHLEHNDKLFNEMATNILQGILTDDELESIKRTDVYFTPNELIEREIAVPWIVYKEMQKVQLLSTDITAIDGHLFLLNKSTERYNAVTEMEIDEENSFSTLQLKYSSVVGVDIVDDEDDESEELTTKGEEKND
jgi:ATP-dependent protease ClpP protease subunit